MCGLMIRPFTCRLCSRFSCQNITSSNKRNWEDFEVAAENMYMADPQNCRYSMKYVHAKGHVLLKMTDNSKCVQYKAENMPDLKKIEKLSSNLIMHMASKDK